MVSNLKVFISYARDDGREYADELYNEFQKNSIQAWRDERNINPFQDFSGEIEKAIESSSHVIVCLTPQIAQKKDSFVRREIIYAQGWKKPILPLIYPDFDSRYLPTLINHLTWLKYKNIDETFSQILIRIRNLDFTNSNWTKDADQFAGYLNRLYKDIVAFLDSTVFSMIVLHSASSPSSIHSRFIETKTHILPVGFVGLSIRNIESVENIEDEEDQKKFTSFKEASEYYNNSILLLGDPGSGKTTTLMAYAREAVASRLENPDQPLPLLVPISRWPSDQPVIFSEWISGLLKLSEKQVSELLDAGRCLLLLDGLDELGNERIIIEKDQKTGEEKIKERFDPRQRFMRSIAKILDKNLAIITCRKTDYENIGDKFLLNGAVSLQPLNENQIQNYLQSQTELLAALKSDASLRQMARTPLLLSILTFAYSSMGNKVNELKNLAHSPNELRDKIFETYVIRRFEHERMRTNLPPIFPLQRIYALLGQLAFTDLIGLGENSIDFVEYSDYLPFTDEENNNGGIDSFLDEVRRLHLMSPLDKYHYRFTHLLIRDYFAFKYCFEYINEDDEEYDKGIVSIGGQGDRRVIDPLIRLVTNYIKDRNYYDESAVIAQAKLNYKYETRRYYDEEIIAGAIDILGNMDVSKIADVLLQTLFDKDDSIRKSSIKALLKFQDIRFIDPIIDVLEILFDEGTLDEEFVRVIISSPKRVFNKFFERLSLRKLPLKIEFSRYFSRDHSIKILISSLDSELDDDDISLLADELEFLEWTPKLSKENLALLIAQHRWNECALIGAEALPFLKRALRNPYYAQAKTNIIETIAQIGDIKSIKSLKNMLNDKDWQVRQIAKAAINMLGSAAN